MKMPIFTSLSFFMPPDMFHLDESFQLAPDLTLDVRWSPRVADFVQDWEHRGRLANEAPLKDVDFTALAASCVLGSIEQGAYHVTQALTDLYEVSGLLPSLGDILLTDDLELRVDERRITVRRFGLTRQVTIAYALGIERYRYEGSSTSGGLQPLSSSFFA